MMSSVLTSLIISTTVPTISQTLPGRLTYQTVKAPELPAWRGDLPQAERTEDGTYLPKPLDEEVLKRLLYLDAYPNLCQKSIDADEQICELRMQAVVEEREPVAWQWPAAIGLVTGVALGYVFGHH